MDSKKQNVIMVILTRTNAKNIKEFDVKEVLSICANSKGNWLSIRSDMELGFLAYYGESGDLLLAYEENDNEQYELVFASAYYHRVVEHYDFFREWKENKDKILKDAEKILVDKQMDGDTNG